MRNRSLLQWRSLPTLRIAEVESFAFRNVMAHRMPGQSTAPRLIDLGLPQEDLLFPVSPRADREPPTPL